MKETDIINSYLSELGRIAEMESLELDSDGSCSFLTNDGTEITLIAPPLHGTLYLASTICPVSDLGTEEKSGLMEKALQRNFLLRGTEGATLSLDDESESLILCQTQPIEEMDASRFVDLVGSFIENSVKQRAKFLQSIPPAGSPSDAGQTTGDTSHQPYIRA